VQLRERRLEVVTVRYDAGRFGRGYKHRPKSTAGIRVVPLAEVVAEVLGHFLPGDRRSLLFPEATRYVLRHGYLRAVRQATKGGYLVGLDLRGPHDLRHTFATWLEDDGIPTRVIDELMGHAATRRPSWASERGVRWGGLPAHDRRDGGPRRPGARCPACGGPLGHRCAQVTVCGRSARQTRRTR
jgi:integrase